MAKNNGLRVDGAVRIVGAPTRVLAAFFDARALAAWWGVLRSVTTPRPLGVYALEWGNANGLTGGVFHGTVMDYRPGRELFVANAYWLPAGEAALGPMGLEVTCSVDGPATRVQVRQSSADGGPRWDRYQDDMTSGWRVSLDALKQYIEDGVAPRTAPDKRPRDAGKRPRGTGKRLRDTGKRPRRA